MDRPLQKDAERRILNLVRARVSDLPTGEPADSEEPDFLFQSDAQVLGIEITQVLRTTDAGGDLQRRTDAELNAVCTLAREICEREGCPPCSVSLIYAPSPNFRKAFRQELATWLAGFVLRNCPRGASKTEFDSRTSKRDPLADGFESIAIRRPGGLLTMQWLRMAVGVVQEDFRLLVQELIDQKTDAFQRYLAKCDACWLVLALHRWDFFDPDAKTVSRIYESPFERTYLVDATSELLWGLNTVPKLRFQQTSQ